MGIKFDEKKNYYVVSYHRRHPVTRASKNISRRGIKTKAEAEKIYKELIIKLSEKFNENLHPLWPEIVARFLEYYANCGNAKNTVKNYKQCIEATLSQFGVKKELMNFRLEKSEILSKKIFQNFLRPIEKVCLRF